MIIPKDEVSGVYINEDSSLGIKFVCRSGYMQIATLDNVTLVHFDSFHEVDRRMARSVHVLDGEYLQREHTAHRHLDRSATRPFNETLNDLLHMEETTLLEDVSHAIGDRGVTGKNTPMMLPFYMFTLKVTQLLDISSQRSMSNDLKEKSPTFPREKRRTGCKKYKDYPECQGLCGPKCWCWKWVCDDCCFHQACYDHDICCEVYGYDSPECVVNPRKISRQCDEHFDC